MAGIQLSGLVSGSFDWQSVVTQLINIESAPITRLQTEQAANLDKVSSLDGLRLDLESLQDAVKGLDDADLFTSRTAASNTSGSSWSPTVVSGAATGTYRVAVSQLATEAKRVGASDIGAKLSASADVSGVTLATMRTAKAVTAGTFTVNDAQVTIATTDSLDEVFQKISDATGGTVTAAYDPTEDKISLTSSTGSLLLGSTTDSSNFLSALKLNNSGGATATSSGALGTVSRTSTLENAGLATAISGSGTFSINGVSIAYDASTDTLNSLLSRINASGAGVSAGYDSNTDRVTLTNSGTGDVGMSATDSAGGILAALGLTTAAGASFVRGNDAQFTVNGGATLTSKSNTLDEDALGVSGLSLTVNSEETQTITVKADTDKMQTAIDTFISAFNDVQSGIDWASQITKTADGKVSTGVLADNREVQQWATKLRSLAFSSVPGSTLTRLESMGIDFSATDSKLSIKSASTLTAALTNSSGEVASFFSADSTGFAARMDDYLGNILDESNGLLKTQTDTLNKQNTSMDEQIAVIKRRLESQRELLTNSFIAMQNAQSVAQQQQTSIENMFADTSSS